MTEGDALTASRSSRPEADSAHLSAIDGQRIVQPILLKRDTMRALGEQAAFAKLSPAQLIARLLDTIVEDDLFAAVLDR